MTPQLDNPVFTCHDPSGCSLTIFTQVRDSVTLAKRHGIWPALTCAHAVRAKWCLKIVTPAQWQSLMVDCHSYTWHTVSRSRGWLTMVHGAFWQLFWCLSEILSLDYMIVLSFCVGCRVGWVMSSARDCGDNVIKASCTLLSASQMSGGSCQSSPAAVQAITLHTSSQKIVVPVAMVCASPGIQSDDGSRPTGSSDSAATSLVVSRASVAAADAGHKPASQKTGSATLVTRRVRFQAKPNISKNARTRWVRQMLQTCELLLSLGRH